MAPTSKAVDGHYQYLVIGGGSGGVSTARRAAKYGAKALVIEGDRLGGTCVNVGCVPKKVMWSASAMADKIRQAQAYGFQVDPALANTFQWGEFKAKRDAYVKRLNGIYARNLDKEGVDYVFGWAQFEDASTITVKLREGGEKRYTADHIVIAAGGTPTVPEGIPGAELGITSDGFFELPTQPKKVAVVGAGYIGIELAGMFHGLGTETHLFIRGETVLRSFDPMIQHMVTDTYVKHGMNVHKKTDMSKFSVEKLENGQLRVNYTDEANGSSHLVVDKLIWTIGRKPLGSHLNIASIGIETDKKGKVITDEYQNTSVPHVYSLGDISDNHFELTPVAIAAGRKLANRLFGPEEYKHQKQDYFDIPSVVFSHPEAGTIGLTEQQAFDKFGKDNVKIYQSKFISMYYAPFEQEDKEFTVYKIICAGPEEKVVGLHLFGDDSAEILQGFGAAVRMGATKADFDNVVAIHPTAAEELVTMT
ncbi:glutathione reductase [Trichomonascus vanleenenianus]|uniref:glutathione-disulfide reductase GLR1 n=1 Tax=Trichomonascus vanleenenianus TaxID=2268995 RepID=UPI003ECA2B13